MSQISITGASTGTATFTIESPATSTNRTITLADATGTMVVSGTTPSLNGITFPATQVASAGANTLDDYEEGSWTPVLSDGTNNATMSAFTGGRYTKIGNVVYLFCYVETTSLGSVTGVIRITGLPFVSEQPISGVNLSGGCAVVTGGLNVTAGYGVTVAVQRSDAYLRLFLDDSAAGTTEMQASEWSADGAAVINGMYRVA